MKTSNSIKIVDLFSGVGGLSYGFDQREEFEIVAASEILPNMAKAYKDNFINTKMFCKDIAEFGIRDLRDMGIKGGEIDIVLGGPPCQAYSTLGRRHLEDPRARLYNEYHRIIKDLNPKVFIYENVVGLASMDGGRLLKNIVKIFEGYGYKIYIKILNAADYGVPQTRKRIFIVGTKLDKEYKFPEPDKRINSSKAIDDDIVDSEIRNYTSIGEALGDLPSLSPGQELKNYKTSPKNWYQELMRFCKGNSKIIESLDEHICPKYNKKLIDLMSKVKEGGSAWELDEKYHPTSGFGNTYARLWWDKPSTTITRNFGTPSSSRCIHPMENRALTTREGARLQSFPDSFKFHGNKSDKNLQIGNAVPPLLSNYIAQSISSHLSPSSNL